MKQGCSLWRVAPVALLLATPVGAQPKKPVGKPGSKPISKPRPQPKKSAPLILRADMSAEASDSVGSVKALSFSGDGETLAVAHGGSPVDFTVRARAS